MQILIHRNGWKYVTGSCVFEMHGEKFAAHKYLDTPDDKVRWTVAHVGTGFSVLAAGHRGGKLPTSRLGAIALAKSSLEHRTCESVKAAIERARGTIEEIIAAGDLPPSKEVA